MRVYFLQAWLQMTDGDFSRFFRKSAHSTKERKDFKGIVCQKQLLVSSCRLLVLDTEE